MRSVALLLICVHSLTAIAAPVMHELFCPHEGRLTEVHLSAPICEKRGCQGIACERSTNDKKVVEGVCAFQVGCGEDLLRNHSRIGLCDGHCVALLNPESSIYLSDGSSRLDRRAFRTTVSETASVDEIFAVHFRTRGPPRV